MSNEYAVNFEYLFSRDWTAQLSCDWERKVSPAVRKNIDKCYFENRSQSHKSEGDA